MASYCVTCTIGTLALTVGLLPLVHYAWVWVRLLIALRSRNYLLHQLTHLLINICTHLQWTPFFSVKSYKDYWYFEHYGTGDWWKVTPACHRVYDKCHLRAHCQETRISAMSNASNRVWDYLYGVLTNEDQLCVALCSSFTFLLYFYLCLAASRAYNHRALSSAGASILFHLKTLPKTSY